MTRDDHVRKLAQVMVMQGKGVDGFNPFPDEVIPAEYNQVFVAKWLGVGPWELDAHPEWYSAAEVCCAASIKAEKSLKESA